MKVFTVSEVLLDIHKSLTKLQREHGYVLEVLSPSDFLNGAENGRSKNIMTER